MYQPDPKRYETSTFRSCGRSGIVLPPVSLGLWQNFGGADVFETGRAVLRRAFDRGVTHFDLAQQLWGLRLPMARPRRTLASFSRTISQAIATN